MGLGGRIGGREGRALYSMLASQKNWNREAVAFSNKITKCFDTNYLAGVYSSGWSAPLPALTKPGETQSLFFSIIYNLKHKKTFFTKQDSGP